MEIKFRAWDGKKMRFPCEIPNIVNYNMPVDREFVDGIETCPPNGGPFEVIEWMQYTGLVDKNGKEIYEGDIVEMESTEKNTLFPNNCFLAEVFIDHNGVQLSKLNTKQIVQPTKEGLKGYWVHTGRYLLGDNMNLGYEIYKGNYIVRVLGNIYENPELLHNNTQNDKQ